MRSIPTSLKPSLIEDYNGANKYVLRFEKGELPPAKGFWSLTMYDEGMFFVANPINRYSMSMRTDPKLESRRVAHHLHPERKPRYGEGSELASCAERKVSPDAAALLAGREHALHLGRLVDHSPGREGRVKRLKCRSSLNVVA